MVLRVSGLDEPALDPRLLDDDLELAKHATVGMERGDKIVAVRRP